MIMVEQLTRRFGAVAALDGFDLVVPPGTVHGLLGANGAGKTTAIRVLTTLLRPSSGHARVAGHDVARHPERVRARIGLVGQHAAVDEELDGRQNLEMFGRLHHLGTRPARARATELLERFDLPDKPVRQYSGGMRRRLDLAAGLIISPAVLFLDEPTTGLDPRARTEVWSAIRRLVANGTTVLLTTQYLDEADQLADHITVIAAGRTLATGTTDALKRRLGDDHLDVVIRDPLCLTDAAHLLAAFGPVRINKDQRQITLPVRDRVAALTGAARALQDNGIDAADIALRQPTLDEVFLHLTAGSEERTPA
ncbi:ATP-binding cassette domain-containing protein [Actinoplanes sp. TBRC 11911]|uniref:ATP-binding cassette domain-containing protein n=1 Tax=Actinoplanes sp. TBRC 11911 TaxID=2729386 RepID=UPI00145FABB0|nr:ATP-binding cassette domain-containing protein [Actinoplanes sp. TBRC 11911]NMO55467.1 ATP-binding cassette domain-containing protein [Actinoplanes sp. TBRC 11911]